MGLIQMILLFNEDKIEKTEHCEMLGVQGLLLLV